MSFFKLTLKALVLERAKRLYEKEKLNSVELANNYDKSQFFKKTLKVTKTDGKKSGFVKHLKLMKIDGTIQNYVLKSIFGFLGGIILTYLLFIFLVFYLNLSYLSATLISSICGLILTIGLAFSFFIRSITFLLLPQLFSKQGRHILMAYIFILTITGPAKNTLHNMRILSESLACGQDQLKRGVEKLIKVIKEPFHALHDALLNILKSVKEVVKKIEIVLKTIRKIMMNIVRVIKSVYTWLASVLNICNKKLGTPFERCRRAFDSAVDDCRIKLGWFSFLCEITNLVKELCYVAKPLELICTLVATVNDAIVGTIEARFKKFTVYMKAMFYVKVDMSFSYKYELNKTKNFHEFASNVVTEINSRTEHLVSFFDWVSLATSCFFIFIILRVIHYRRRWLTSDRFDNKYITNDFRNVDLKRSKADKETLLPLNLHERQKYISLTSMRLLTNEKLRLTKSLVFLSLTSCKLCIYISIDYSLYWILNIINYHSKFQFRNDEFKFQSTEIFVSGNGYIAELYDKIIESFSPDEEAGSSSSFVSSLSCIPEPILPDYDCYIKILVLIIICWCISLFEPYGLRIRQIIMCYYHPDRSKERAVWLYNHIIKSRGSFLKYARRQLRRQYAITMNGEDIEKITLKERFIVTLKDLCPILNILLNEKQNLCLLCGTSEMKKNPHIKCQSFNCVGIFCSQCFNDINNFCTICKNPIDYGDFSDFSHERDSSDEEEVMKQIKV